MQQQRSLSVEDDSNIELSDVHLLLKFRDFQSFWGKKGGGGTLIYEIPSYGEGY